MRVWFLDFTANLAFARIGPSAPFLAASAIAGLTLILAVSLAHRLKGGKGS